MQRRTILKQLLMGSLTAKAMVSNAGENASTIPEPKPHSQTRYSSKWQLLPDMTWTGEDLWAQRLQDWCVKDGQLQCLVQGADRTINILTHQLNGEKKELKAELKFSFLDTAQNNDDLHVGFRFGLKGRFNDYRSAIFTGKGIDAGITRNGKLFIGENVSDKTIEENKLTQSLRLVLALKPTNTVGYYSKLTILDKAGNTLASINTTQYDEVAWQGNMAIACISTSKETKEQPAAAFESLIVEGDKLDYSASQVYGPIYFAQYTKHDHVLKLTAQLAPMDISHASALLQVLQDDQWKTIGKSSIHPLARTANFKIEDWKEKSDTPYRVLYDLELRNKRKKQFVYEGIIAAEPTNKKDITALTFSCNWDLGFPDEEVVTHASKHKADIAFFLGDQFYEGNGGFGIQMAPIEKSTLDYLRKWYMFGWSYRDLFRNIPMVALPDDHDMYHGNIWGSGGRPTIATGGAAVRQDSGGYKMPADWVNMAQLTQTSHMPDAYDPTPALQGIKVYYTIWNYAGLSFGLIEDRKFKSAPKDILPEEAKVYNGYAQNPGYDTAKEKAMEAHLLGERQMKFLSYWTSANKEADFNILVSATPFCCLQTLPAGTHSDEITPKLTVPLKGEYVTGDMPTKDMDSNGWPHNRRDEVLRMLDKKVDIHITGDQHLPSIVKYGVDEFGDNMYCFAAPALNNLWPRRWWPTLAPGHQPIAGKPEYTGNFEDGFGNKITVYAAASPCKSNREPALLYDRSTGYGVVQFNKSEKSITINCWPRYADPAAGNSGQYDGWPFTFNI